MYYRSTITEKIMSSVSVIDDVYGEGKVDSLLRVGVLEKIEQPDLIDIIRNGTKTAAILRYREIHGCSLAKARDMVEALRADMSRLAVSP